MVLENLLNVDSQSELANLEEKYSKTRAKELFDNKTIESFEVGTFKGLSQIHKYLFQDVYPFAGKLRDKNIAKGNFRFAPLLYITQALEQIDKMPEDNFNHIIEKYVEMNIAHPFREGNGRSTRLWLDQILKHNMKMVIDWNAIDKEEYLTAMILSPASDLSIKELLKSVLTDKIDDSNTFFKGIDASYYYEGYVEYKTEDL